MSLPPFLLALLASGCCTPGLAQYMAENRERNASAELYAAGDRAYRAGDHTTAANLFTRVIELDADHINALLQRGSCNVLLGHYAKAIEDLSAVIDRRPDHSRAYTSRGSAYLKLNEPQRAIADFTKVLELDPKNEEAYNNRGWSHKALGDHAAACRDWNASERMGNTEAKIILTNNRCK